MLGNRRIHSEQAEVMKQKISNSLSAAGKALMDTSHALTLPMEFVSPATRLLEKRRQMFEIQETLCTRKKEFLQQEQFFAEREESFRKKDVELQESVLKCNKLFQETESKRNRAIKRGNEEIKQRLNKEQEIVALRKTLASLLQESHVLARQLRKHSKYARYLELAQEQNAEDFPQVNDLVNRYRTLSEANRDLRRNQMQCERQNEQKRAEYTAYQKEKANEILNRNNQIASLQCVLENEETSIVQLQQDVDVSFQTNMKKTLALGQILIAIDHLLQRATSGMHGRLLKHGHGHGPGTDAGHGTGTGTGTGTASEATPNENAENLSTSDMMHHCVTAMVNLDIVACYMNDYASIIQKWAETHRPVKKQNGIMHANSGGPGVVQMRLAGRSGYKAGRSAFSLSDSGHSSLDNSQPLN